MDVSKPSAAINLTKSLTFIGNFCKGVKMSNFSSEIISGQLLQTFGVFYWSHWLAASFFRTSVTVETNSFTVPSSCLMTWVCN